MTDKINWTEQDYLDDLTAAYKAKQPPAPTMARALYNLERIAAAVEMLALSQRGDPNPYPSGH